MAPGTVATCSASWPSDIDLSCGFHARRSPGTRSSTRRVVFASCSSSCSSISMVDITVLLHTCLAARLRLLPDTLVQRRPSAHDTLAEIVGDEAKCRMPERHQRPAIHLLEPV